MKISLPEDLIRVSVLLDNGSLSESEAIDLVREGVAALGEESLPAMVNDLEYHLAISDKSAILRQLSDMINACGLKMPSPEVAGQILYEFLKDQLSRGEVEPLFGICQMRKLLDRYPELLSQADAMEFKGLYYEYEQCRDFVEEYENGTCKDWVKETLDRVRSGCIALCNKETPD